MTTEPKSDSVAEHMEVQEIQEPDPKVSASTIMAVFFMGMTYVPAITCGLVLSSFLLAQIGVQLNDTKNVSWIPTAWSVASAVSFAIAGGLSDIFGRRNVLLSGQVIVLVGSIVAGTAKTVLTIVAGSTIIGFGAGIIFVSYPGISELLPNKYRGIGLGWTEFCIGFPWIVAGVLLANQLNEHATWRWIYYIGIIYSGVVIVGTAVFYFPPSRPQGDYERTRWQEFKDLDFIGLLLFTAGIVLFLVGFAYLGQPTYSKSLVASTTVIGGLVLIGAFAYDFTIPKNPIFPFHLFSMFREYTVHLVVLFIAGMIWQTVTTWAPQATLFIFTHDPVQIGLVQMPNNWAGFVGGWVFPSLVHKIKNIRYQIIFALVLQTVFTALYAVAIPKHKWMWAVFQLFGQCCFTWVTTLAYVSSSLCVPQEELGVSAGLIGTFRSAGGSVGNTIFSTIITSVLNKRLAPNIIKAALAAGFPADQLEKLVPAAIGAGMGAPNTFSNIPAATAAVIAATQAAFKDAYAHAFKVVFLATIPFGVVAIVAALFLKDASHLLNNKVAVRQEKEVLARKSVTV
ncbi:siderophore iron transporter, putative [Talaromyces stipitatus ATCC 10500]|uniref:Siderophore iron transporter, putative n=1 Tax=Talaromyces stipitatus (strain ATCC 10500 / CBS 375.48 / QM 6759 / NRRL 1006) TaxID=441959 RepID=B8MGS8_TALSN|nr:siderophore iron transporter, putative [Talaromyces stipitatus ATCC 10500]EED16309.1 siderophore iron transporter, putative [Talaromyces stipitatus ATCC 10500]